MKCFYSLAWVGPCNKTAGTNGLCEEHSKEKCCSCGEQATRQCPETAQFVCGESLCNECEHTICENGCNSGAKLPEGYKEHCKKDKQIYTPWYMEKI